MVLFNTKKTDNHKSNNQKVKLLSLLAANILLIALFLSFHSCQSPELGVSAVEQKNLGAAPTAAHNVPTAATPTAAAAAAAKQTTLLQLEPCARLGDSQDNQDCIIEKIFAAIGTTNKYYVEYGFNTNQQCSFSGPNSCRLWRTGGWNGLLLDGSHTNATINLQAHYLYSNNMVAILDKYNVPKEADFYSGDMDSHDYFVMKSVLDSGKYRPRVITTEYNANYPKGWAVSQVDPTISEPLLIPPPYKFQDCTWGASPAAFHYLMEKHGYQMVAVTHILDLFWIRNDVLEEHGLVPAASFEALLVGKNTVALHPQKADALFLNQLVDVKVFEETKNFRQANRAMVQTILDHIKSTTEATVSCLARISVADIEAYLQLHPPIGQHLELS